MVKVAIRTAAALVLCAGVAGCMTATSRSAGQGDFKSVAEGSAQSDFAELEAYDHYLVCKAYQSLQRLADLDRCLASLRPRLETEQLSASVVTYTDDYETILLEGLEVEKYLAVGDYDAAAAHGETALSAAEGDPRVLFNSGISAMYSVLTFGLNDPNSETGAYAERTRTHAKVEPLGWLATAEALRGNGDAAQRYRDRLQAIYADADKSQDKSNTTLIMLRRWLGQSYFLEGRYEEAYDAFTRDDRSGLEVLFDGFTEAILILEKPIVEPIAYATVGTNFDDVGFSTTFPLKVMIARTTFNSGRIDAAAEGYDEILAEPRLVGFGDMHFQILYERGQIARAQGDADAAERYFRRAVDVLESQRAQLETESYKLGFVENRNDVYFDLVDLLVQRGRPVDAFEFAERAKARAMVDMLASRSQFATDNAVAGALVAELDRLERAPAEGGRPTAEAVRTRVAAIDQKRAELNEVAPELASLVTVTATDAAAIQARLAPDEALLEYFGQDEALFAFVVTRDAVRVQALPPIRLGSTVTNFRRSAQNVRADAYKDAGERLYSRIVSPIAGMLDGYRKLTVVPHGAMHYLPFAALYDGRDYLVDRFEMRLLPSASVVEFLAKRTAEDRALLALGNPDVGSPELDLPGAEAETRAIDQDWERSQTLLGEEATEARFKRFSPGFQYLHLASHGVFEPERPLRSRLMLAPGEGEDGDLTVDELYDLRLRADLVTLSACDTGLGSVETGDDVIGLTRGFLYAGARAVVASLWPVSDDATAFFMERFYGHLKSMEKAAALRQAMIETRKEFPHPVYWAAFQITGGAWL